MTTTTSERDKALRGTKRACHACEVRFYDLARSPILCPACGAVHTPAPAHVAVTAPSFTSKTGWRSKGPRREAPVPVAPEEVPETVVEDEELADAPAAAASADEDIVLEPEADETDVSDLVGHDDNEPKER
jgi:uncharacterized protein (TIGR02300 family)